MAFLPLVHDSHLRFARKTHKNCACFSGLKETELFWGSYPLGGKGYKSAVYKAAGSKSAVTLVSPIRE